MQLHILAAKNSQDSIVRSKRTTRFPGAKEQTAEHKIWERINEHEGKIRYQINRDIPSLNALYDVLGESEKKLLDIAISQIECYLPKYSIVNDNMDSLNIVNTGIDAEEERLIEEIIDIISMFDESKKHKMFDDIFLLESYQKLHSRKDEIRRRVFPSEK